MSNTLREGRLFPNEDHGRYGLSIQGSVDHHCSPRKDLDRLEDYDAVEVVVYGPEADGSMLEPEMLEGIGIPKSIVEKFDCIGIGVKLTWKEVDTVRSRIKELDLEVEPSDPKPFS